MPNQPTQDAFDIAVVGGNISGAASAVALHQLGLKVCLIEPNPIKLGKPKCYRLRVSAISPVSENFLTHLDCWQALPYDRIQKVKTMLIGENNQWLEFNQQQTAYQRLAQIVENDQIQHTLWQQLKRAKMPIFKHRLANFEQSTKNAARWQLSLTNKQSLSCQLLIAADGVNSLVRQQAGIGWQQKDYQQYCLVANLRPQYHHRHTAWQAYHNGLAIALLPHPDQSCSLAWYVSPEKAKQIQTMNLSDSQQAVNKALQQAHLRQLGSVTLQSPLQSFVIRRGRADCYAQPGLILVGDACRSIHPMAGQGLNLALADVAVLQQELATAQNNNLSIDHFSISQHYQRRRSEDKIIQYGMDLINTLFNNQALRPWRSQLLRISNNLPAWQQPLLSLACGQWQDLAPQLKNYH